MKERFSTLFIALLTLFFASSCESTLDYGYYVGGLSDDTILEMFALIDESVAERDFTAYQSFYAPNFSTVDKSGSDRRYLYRQEYLDAVETLFDKAKELSQFTRVMDITYGPNNESAVVKVQLEERSIQFGDTKHYSSLADVEVGFDEGWIYIDRWTTTTVQIFEE